VILDCAEVRIGDRTQIAPGVQLLAADHPREPELRRELLELARPVTIGSNVWIGAAAIVCPGVSVGDDSIIGAGSVVTRDVPAGVVAAGVPARVVREL
jgi:maltose O-acetyltransferase